jgi:hypothetical protein
VPPARCGAGQRALERRGASARLPLETAAYNPSSYAVAQTTLRRAVTRMLAAFVSERFLASLCCRAGAGHFAGIALRHVEIHSGSPGAAACYLPPGPGGGGGGGDEPARASRAATNALDAESQSAAGRIALPAVALRVTPHKQWQQSLLCCLTKYYVQEPSTAPPATDWSHR